MANEQYIPTLSKNENTSTASLFEARSFFYNYTIPFVTSSLLTINNGESIILGDLYNENSMYGTLDHEGDVIYPIVNNKVPLSIVGVEETTGKNLYLQTFVAQTLNEMRDHLNSQILKNCFGMNNVPNGGRDSAFFNIQVKKAYFEDIDVSAVYSLSMDVLALTFRKAVLSNEKLNKSIINHQTFMKEYVKFLAIQAKKAPVIFSRSICYYNLKLANNTLSFSISMDDPGDQENTFKKYYNDIGFLNFVTACYRFGFKIDKNAPYVLYPDLNSANFKKYSKQKGEQEIFINNFAKAYLSDLGELKKAIYKAYKIFIGQGETNNLVYDTNYEYDSGQKKCIKKELNRTSPNDSIFYEAFSNKFWLRLYVYLKNIELNMGFTQEKFENIVKVATTMDNVIDTTSALEYINSNFDETKGVLFYDSLQEKNGMVQQDVPEIIF